MLALFKGEYHLDRAIDAALAIRDKIASLPVQNEFLPRVSIGINSGEMISGNIGSATLRRLDYTVIGDAVNVAQRLERVASAGQVVISAACFEKVKNSFECKSIGSFALKNKTGEMELYEVIK